MNNLGNKFATTTEEQILKLAKNHEINRNWLQYEAVKAGVDFDADTKDEFNRINEEYDK